MADQLGLRVGDLITLTSPDGDITPMGVSPRIKSYKISGLFEIGMKWVEQAGLVKFDFLGLKTLTVLKVAVDFVAKLGIKVDLAAIPLDDKKTYEMLSRGETVGVFQVESAGM